MNTVKKLTCVVCPAGCPLEVTLAEDGTILSVTGNTCKRGQAYAQTELTHPMRTLTTTVTLQSKAERRLPVKTDKPIPKESLFAAMEIAEKIIASAPIKRGDVICADFIEAGTNLVACKSIDE